MDELEAKAKGLESQLAASESRSKALGADLEEAVSAKQSMEKKYNDAVQGVGGGKQSDALAQLEVGVGVGVGADAGVIVVVGVQTSVGVGAGVGSALFVAVSCCRQLCAQKPKYTMLKIPELLTPTSGSETYVWTVNCR